MCRFGRGAPPSVNLERGVDSSETPQRARIDQVEHERSAIAREIRMLEIEEPGDAAARPQHAFGERLLYHVAGRQRDAPERWIVGGVEERIVRERAVEPREERVVPRQVGRDEEA